MLANICPSKHHHQTPALNFDYRVSPELPNLGMRGNCSSRRGQVPFFRHACATNPFGTRPPAYGAEAQGILNSTLPIYIARSAGTECGKWSGRGPSCRSLGRLGLPGALPAARRRPNSNVCLPSVSEAWKTTRGDLRHVPSHAVRRRAARRACGRAYTGHASDDGARHIYAHHAHHRRSSSARARSHAR